MSSSAPSAATTASTPAPIAPAAGGALEAASPGPRGAAYHRLVRVPSRQRYWWRPLAAVCLFAVSYGILFILLLVGTLILGLLDPSLAPSDTLMHPRNPMDMLAGLGMLALLIPAVLIASRIAYGRAGLVHSVAGRYRWGLLGRAAIVILPLYAVVNIGATLALEGSTLERPPLTAPVIAAWIIIILLVPLQAAGEEYAFRALPMQMFGTWLRSPLWGILLPVPLFMAGHGYDWVGQVDLAVFAASMGALAWKTGGVELPILIHAANNWTLFLVAPLLPNALEQGAVPPIALLTSTVPTVLVTAGLWWWFSKREGLGLWEPARGGC